MKYAFTTQDAQGWASVMEPRFGRAAYLVIVDEASRTCDIYDNRATLEDAHGAGPKMAKAVLDRGVNVIITGNGPGENAQQVLSKASIEVFVGAEGTVQEAYDAYTQGRLKRF